VPSNLPRGLIIGWQQRVCSLNTQVSFKIEPYFGRVILQFSALGGERERREEAGASSRRMNKGGKDGGSKGYCSQRHVGRLIDVAFITS